MRFYIVDVFAETKLAGNQLAVFRDCADLSTVEMQKIAAEMHVSETTFITSERQREGGYDVRIFTPDFELPFAGHPTLGTAYVLQSKVIGKQVDQVRLNLKVGQIPVSVSYKSGKPDLLWMRQKEPVFGRSYTAAPVARALGLSPSDIDLRFPIQDVSTGLLFTMVPLKSLDAVRRIHLDHEKADTLLASSKSLAFLVFSTETYNKGNDLNVRVIGPSPSIPEDPATGSANGCLAAYLVKHSYFGSQVVDVRVEQGYEIGRNALLLLKARKHEGGIEVNVGGRVQFIASGEFSD